MRAELPMACQDLCPTIPAAEEWRAYGRVRAGIVNRSFVVIRLKHPAV